MWDRLPLRRAQSRQLILGSTLLFVGGIVCYYFPLFHIRPMGGESAENAEQFAILGASDPTNAAAYVRDFWDGPLQTGAAATEITRPWEAFDANALKAKNGYGRQAGLGGPWYFCMRGRGTINSMNCSV